MTVLKAYEETFNRESEFSETLGFTLEKRKSRDVFLRLSSMVVGGLQTQVS